MSLAHVDRLLTPFRVVRRATAPGDAPFPGTLCRARSGATVLLVAVEDLPADWAGWRVPRGSHVLGAADLVRRLDGHDVLLPAFAGRVDDLLARRGGCGDTLAAGEAVTLAVSMVRALGDWDAADPPGQWWMTDAGRPVLVHTSAGDAGRSVTLRLLRLLVDGSSAGAPRESLAALSDAPWPAERELAQAEAALFSWGAATPVRMQETTGTGAAPGARVAHPSSRSYADPPHPWWHSLARHVDADLADLVSRTTTDLWRRVRSRGAGSPTRRRPWLLAAGVAAILVGAGIVWPTPDSATTADDAGAPPATTATGVAAPDPDPAVSAPPAPLPTDAADRGVAGDASSHLVDVLADLLEARNACADDVECLDEVSADPAAVFPGGPADLPRDQRTLALIDDFGGVAVLSVSDGAGARQLAVIELIDRRWLLRDIRDAQEPAG